MKAQVAYACQAAAHRDGEGGPDKLTVHDRKWAYCPYDARADGHDWQPAGDLTLSMLQQQAAIRPRSEERDPDPKP